MEKTIGDNRKLRNGFITYFIVLIALGAVLIPVLPGGALPLEIICQPPPDRFLRCPRTRPAFPSAF